MGRRSRRRRRQRAANARAKARSIAARRRSSVVKKKTPTRTRRTIARLRTPITRKAPITKRTTSRRTRRKITSTARKTRRRTVRAKTVVPTAAQRKRARRRTVIRTTVPTAAQRKRARTKATVRRRVVNKATRVKRNKRDRGFTKVTRVPTRFRPADTVSRRAGRIVTRPRGALTSPFELDVQGDQSPTTFFDRRNQSGRRLAGERGGGVFTRDSDGLPVDDGVPRGDRRPPRPSPIPNTVPSNPKDVVVNVSTFVNGKTFGGAEITENGRKTGQRSNASLRYNIKMLLGNGKTITANLNNYQTTEYYTIRAVTKNETITTQVPVPPDDFVNPSFIIGGLKPMEDRRFRVGPNNRFGGGFARDTGMTQLYNMRRQAQQARLKPRFKTVTRTVEKTLIEWNYYKDGKLVNSSSIVPGQNYNAKINFSKVIGPVDDINDTPDDDFTPTNPDKPPVVKKPELLIIPQGDFPNDLYAASVNGNNVS